jgi:hypothetical protein
MSLRCARWSSRYVVTIFFFLSVPLLDYGCAFPWRCCPSTTLLCFYDAAVLPTTTACCPLYLLTPPRHTGRDPAARECALFCASPARRDAQDLVPGGVILRGNQGEEGGGGGCMNVSVWVEVVVVVAGLDVWFVGCFLFDSLFFAVFSLSKNLPERTKELVGVCFVGASGVRCVLLCQRGGLSQSLTSCCHVPRVGWSHAGHFSSR